MSALTSHTDALRETLDRLRDMEGPLLDAARTIARSFRSGGKMLAAGNGGSAAEAQHLTSELVGRLHADRDRRALPAIALHGDTSALTAVGNDYGYDHVFARQVEAIGRRGDVLVVLSTSGGSPNLVRAVDVANDLGLVSIGLLGSGIRPLHERCGQVLAVPSHDVATIQECHLVVIHALVEEIEHELAAAPGAEDTE